MFRTTNEEIQWKFMDALEWETIYTFTDDDPREVEFRQTETSIEWKYTDESTWKIVASVDNPQDVEFRTIDNEVQWRYIGTNTWQTAYVLGETETIINPDKFVPDDFVKKYLIEANPAKGFNIPYFLYIPTTNHQQENEGFSQYLILEGTNFGYVTNYVDQYIYDNLIRGETSHVVGRLFEELHVPKVVPYLPKTCFRINHGNYTEYGHFHALDSTVIEMKSHIDQIEECSFNNQNSDVLGYDYLNSLIDIEEQIHAIVLDAQEKLNSNYWNLEEQIFVAGFSASGSYAQRYTSIYPEQVKAMFAGGMFLPILPVDSYGGHDLIYQIGTYDHERLFGRALNVEAYNDVAKIFYMGANETIDAVGGSDTFTNEHRTIIYDIYGTESINSRWYNAQDIFYQVGGDALFITDKAMGHEVANYTTNYIIEFFKQNRDSTEAVYSLELPSPTLLMRYHDQIIEDPDFDLNAFDEFSDKTLVILGGKDPVESFSAIFRGYFDHVIQTSNFNNEGDYIVILATEGFPFLYNIDIFENEFVASSTIKLYTVDTYKVIYIYEETVEELIDKINSLEIDFIINDYDDHIE